MPSTRRSTIAECKELARRVEELSGAPEGILEIADVALYGVVNDPSSVAETLRSFLEGRSRESAAARSGASTGGTIRVGTSGTPSASTAHRWRVEVDPRTGASSVVIDEDASEQEREEALRAARTTAGSVDATRGTVAPPDATTADEERRRANAERTRRWREARRAAEESNAASEAVRREANAQRTREWRQRRAEEALAAERAASEERAAEEERRARNAQRTRDWRASLRNALEHANDRPEPTGRGAARFVTPAIAFDGSGSMAGVDVEEIARALNETALRPAHHEATPPTPTDEAIGAIEAILGDEEQDGNRAVEYRVPTSRGFGATTTRDGRRTATRAPGNAGDAARAAIEAGEAANAASERTAAMAREVADFIVGVGEGGSVTVDAIPANPTAGELLRGIASAARERGDAYRRLSGLASQITIDENDVDRAEVALSSAISSTGDLEPLVEMADVITANAGWFNSADREYMESVVGYHRHHRRGMTPSQEIHFRRILRKRKHLRTVINFMAGRTIAGPSANAGSIVPALPEPGQPACPALAEIGRDIGRMEWPVQVEERIRDRIRAGNADELREMLIAAERQGVYGSRVTTSPEELRDSARWLEAGMRDEADVARASRVLSRPEVVRALAEVAAGIRRRA